MDTITDYFDSISSITKKTYENGDVTYTHNGVPHRHDGPAIIKADGTKMWFRHGERHREGGPAQEYPDGSRHWYQNNVLHRQYGAAIEEPNGTRHWYHNGKLVALDDTAGAKHLEQAIRANPYF